MSQKNGRGAGGQHVYPHAMAFMLDNWLRKLVQDPAKMLQEYVKPKMTVLDFGCGPGFFSLPMAEMVGEEGKVIAADLQNEMLEVVRKKASRRGVEGRMLYQCCSRDAIGCREVAVDFILAYYVLHETGDRRAILGEMKNLLSDKGNILIVEPKMHVSENDFEATVEEALNCDLQILERPKRKGGRTVLLGH